MKNEKDLKNLQAAMDSFLETKPQTQEGQEMDCSSGVCIIKNDKSLVEKINKKIIIEDGRQLLI
jgi:hypothetical protein